MVEAGADLIELGIPFSDPTAEGPVIQGANIRALADGMTTTNDVFDLVQKLRKDSHDSDGIYDLCKCCLSLTALNNLSAFVRRSALMD